MNASSKNFVWVVAEHFKDQVRPVTYEIIAFATRFAVAIESEIRILAVGSNVETVAQEIAATTGLDVVGINCPAASVYIAEVYRGLLKMFFEKSMPQFIFIPHTATGWDFAPALAVDLGASNITAAVGFKFEECPIFIRRICNGKIHEDVRPVEGTSAIVTVMPGAEPVIERKPSGPGLTEIVSMDNPQVRSKTIGYVEAPPDSVNLQKANVIVAAGRGISAPEHIEMIRELAGLFDRGAVGASRPVCDMGWMPHDYQVGMTGQTVSPTLYIACGISGAVQHTMGMNKSDLIVAVNRDVNALFFTVAHYCILADLHKFLPVLIEKIRELKKATSQIK